MAVAFGESSLFFTTGKRKVADNLAGISAGLITTMTNGHRDGIKMLYRLLMNS